ncbi:hypothetical protein H5410_005246 [Solanum commersonii]|uniref:Uncharacterized protein n=1 Tax=Solanum commersonii TaxID=4109 RepID=A0A9J6A718_SOLCO|nr:hypothetical protein H5410_005246 [Solanum commersonii]
MKPTKGRVAELIIVVEVNEIVVANTISSLSFWLARERGRKTKTTKLMAVLLPHTQLERVSRLRRRLFFMRQLGVREKLIPNAPPLPTAPTNFPASSSAPLNYHASSSSTTKRVRGRGRGNTSPEKRSRVIGMSVFQVTNGFKVMNLGMPSSKIYSTGQVKVKRFDVTGDIGYTPSNTSKLKWNGKATILTSKLNELIEKQRKKTMGSSSNNPSQNNTSSQSKMPWKL